MDNKPLTELEKNKAERKKRADTFWGMFLPTKNGKVKSTVLLYSVFLGFLFTAVHVLAFLLLADYLEPAFPQPQCPVWLTNVMGSLIPGVIAVALCCSLFFLFKQKQLVFGGYLCVTLYVVVLMLATIPPATPEVRPVFWTMYAQFVPIPLALGLGVSLTMLLVYRKKHPPEIEVVPRKAWQ